MGIAAYSVNIVGLSNKEHHFQYEFGGEFFRKYGTDIVSEGKFLVDLLLTKHDTFIETAFKISGAAHLVCDRSLEVTDEIIVIPRDTATLELGQYIYEFIALAIPLKKVHPKFQDDAEDESEGKIVYTSEATEERKDEEETDPRWNILKKLK